MSFDFLDRFSKNTQILNLTKIRPVGVELVRVGAQTDRHDAANNRFTLSCEPAWKRFLSFERTQERIGRRRVL